MKKNIILLGALLISGVAFSQVGINTETPKATLDVVATPTDAAKIDGFIAPRLEGTELQGKNSLYGTEQTGTIVYVKSASPEAGTTGDKTINVDSAGYYYFNGTVWVKFNGAASGSGTAIEPWYVQNTSDQAENNTDNIYQQGKVAVGFTSADAVSDKQLEVKGDFRALKHDDATGLYYLMETANDFPSGKANTMAVTDNLDMNAATKSNFLEMNAVATIINTTDVSDPNKKIISRIQNYILPDGGASSFGSGVLNESNGNVEKEAAVETFTWTDNPQVRLAIGKEDGITDQSVDLYLRSSEGITFQHRGFEVGVEDMGYDSYTFPRQAPEEGQVLVGAGSIPGWGRQLEWKSPTDILKSAMPKFFYMPSVEIPTHDTTTGNTLSGTQTINLYDSYTQQFQYTGGIGQVRSNTSSSIPTLPADELDYFITYYDTDVFENVAVSTTGVLTYQVKPTAVVTNKTFMNIIFKVKD